MSPVLIVLGVFLSVEAKKKSYHLALGESVVASREGMAKDVLILRSAGLLFCLEPVRGADIPSHVVFSIINQTTRIEFNK